MYLMKSSRNKNLVSAILSRFSLTIKIWGGQHNEKIHSLTITIWTIFHLLWFTSQRNKHIIRLHRNVPIIIVQKQSHQLSEYSVSRLQHAFNFPIAWFTVHKETIPVHNHQHVEKMIGARCASLLSCTMYGW